MSGFAIFTLVIVLTVGIVAVAWNRFAVRAVAVSVFSAIALFIALSMYGGGYRAVATLVERDGGQWNADALAGAVVMREIHKPGAVTLFVILAFLAVLSLRRYK